MFNLGQTIHFMRENRPHSAPVLARATVENAHEDWVCTEAQKNLFTPFGPAGIFYSICFGVIKSADCYDSVESLATGIINPRKPETP